MKHLLQKKLCSLMIGLALVSLAGYATPARAQNAVPKAGKSAKAGVAPKAAASNTVAAPKVAAKAPRLTGSIWVNTTGSYYRDTPRIDRFIDDLRAKPFREAVIQVVDNQCAYYNSALLPPALGIPAHFDPLLVLTKGLRAAPGTVRLAAWINPYAAGNVNHSAPLGPNHVSVAHPEWLSLRADGSKTDGSGNLYLEAGLPEVQQYLESEVRELVHQYPIDGIYFDLMGDPDADWGYHPAVVAAWQARTGRQETPAPGDPTWIALRAEVITKALDGLTRAARSQRANLTVGAGARADGAPPASLEAFHQGDAYRRYHQDWPAWAAAAKPISRLYLQDFKSEETDKGAFEGWVNFALQTTRPTPVKLVVGVAGHLNDSILTLGQMRKAVQAGADDVALSDYEKPVRDQESQALFMTAVLRTVLSPEYYASVAALNRAASLATSATLAASGASTRTLVAAGGNGGAGEGLPLPPPPKPGAGALLTSATTTRAGEGEVQVKSQRVVAGGEGDEATTMTIAAPETNAGAATRRQMLEELIKDPQFSQSPDSTLIRPGESDKAYLKARYGNIFSD